MQQHVARIHRLSQSEGLRSSALMIIGNLTAQGMSGVAIILLSRLLGPAEFGVFSSGFAIAMIVGSFVDAGMAAAQAHSIPRAEQPADKNDIFGTVIAIKLALFAAILLGALLFADYLSTALNLPSSGLLIWLLAANIGSLFFNQLAGMLTSLQKIGAVVSINIAQAVSKLLLVAVLFLTALDQGETTLLVYLLLPIFILPVATIIMPNWYRPSAAFDADSWRKLRPMAINSWIAAIGGVLVQNADVVIVGMLLSQYDAGLIGSASRLAMFVALIGSSLSGVLNPRVSGYRRRADLEAYWKKALLILAGAALLSLASFVVSYPILLLTSGADYLAAAPALSWLLAASWLSVGIAPLSALFFSYDKPWYFSVASLVQGGLTLVLIYLLMPEYGLIAAGWARMLAQLVILLFTLALAVQSHRQHIVKFDK